MTVLQTASKQHEALKHDQAEMHHGHSHADGSLHAHGHHLLNVSDLSVGFRMYDASASFWRAKLQMNWVIHDLSISVHQGEILAIVGASGSGKTLLADSIMGMFAPNSEVVGTIYFDGKEQTEKTLQQHRGKEIAFIPQSVSALDPLMKVGKQIGGHPDERAKIMHRYGLDPKVENMYPHELSGGMARRVFLCMAQLADPKLIVADEPTPGLDLSLAQTAMQDLREFADNGGGVLLITHDIDLALSVADRIAVFKDGTVVEETSVESFKDPSLLRHSFSRRLWHAMPEHDFVFVSKDL